MQLSFSHKHKEKAMKKRDNEKRREKDTIETEGTIVKILNGMMYKVKHDNGIETIGVLSGKIRQFNIKIALGDRVKMEMSPYDLSKGRITYRLKG